MKKVHVLGAAFLILAFVFTFLYMIWNTVGEDVYLGSRDFGVESDDWKLTLDGQEKGSISIPVEMKRKNYKTVSIEKQISLDNSDEQYICFRSSQNKIWVYVESTLVYTYGVEGNYALSKSPGSAWNLIKLPENKKDCQVKIVFSSPYRMFSGTIAPVYIGTKSGIVTYLFERYMPTFFVGCLYILVACFVLGSYLILRNVRIECGLYFSAIIFHLGLWFLLEAKLDQFLFHTPYLFAQLNCILVVTFPMMLLLYILSLDEYKADRLLRWIARFSVLNAVIVVILEWLQTYDFIQTIWTVAFLFFAILVGVVRNMYQRFYREKRIKSLNWRDFGLTFMIVTAIHDMLYSYYSCEIQSGRWFRFGVFLFIIVIFIGFEKEFVQLYFAQMEDERFKILAYTDALTGLANRASFEEEMEVIRKGEKESEPLYIVMIDINNLKDINDNLGHKLGDRAIIQVAKLIHNSFGKYGSCYRIGGDEFCIIIHKIHGIKLKYVLDKLNHDISGTFFVEGYQLTIAYGYERYDTEMTGNIDDVLVCADKKMYSCKQYMKGNVKK